LLRIVGQMATLFSKLIPMKHNIQTEARKNADLFFFATFIFGPSKKNCTLNFTTFCIKMKVFFVFASFHSVLHFLHIFLLKCSCSSVYYFLTKFWNDNHKICPGSDAISFSGLLNPKKSGNFKNRMLQIFFSSLDSYFLVI